MVTAEMTIRPMTESDRDAVISVRRQSFNASAEFAERSRSHPLGTQSVWEEDGQILGAAALHPFAHFFGGRPVPAAGVSGVVVTPHARGRRVAEQLVGSLLLQARSEFALSSLYPATVPLYRRLGFEFGAARTQYQLAFDAMPHIKDAGQVEPWDDAVLDEVAAAQREWAGSHNGLIERPTAWWERRTLMAEDRPVHRYLVREDGRVTGSIVYTQEKDWRFEIACRDFWWSTPHAARALLTFLARHSSIGKKVQWWGPPNDPMIFLIAEDAVRKSAQDMIQFPMFRVLDVPAAIAARGYVPELSTSVTIQIDDPLIPQNCGPWRIAVDGGKGAAEPAVQAQATLPIGAFSAIYTGFLTPTDAVRTGLISAPAPVVDTLSRMFSGSAPWLADFF